MGRGGVECIPTGTPRTQLPLQGPITSVTISQMDQQCIGQCIDGPGQPSPANALNAHTQTHSTDETAERVIPPPCKALDANTITSEECLVGWNINTLRQTGERVWDDGWSLRFEMVEMFVDTVEYLSVPSEKRRCHLIAVGGGQTRRDSGGQLRVPPSGVGGNIIPFMFTSKICLYAAIQAKPIYQHHTHTPPVTGAVPWFLLYIATNAIYSTYQLDDTSSTLGPGPRPVPSASHHHFYRPSPLVRVLLL
ncbi:hypothetical protein EX30DRAFT_350631 [Ascodesmis nigricans]|uniref:Uncharacterized protein n=1 Tax=Ascodesmis nigricans TaxID=341454 RepID=A0A4S2MSK0_9PEZI|nr:hypothetical protein EX30DRAFT_350631 [Ascodesmis nigricans]